MAVIWEEEDQDTYTGQYFFIDKHGVHWKENSGGLYKRSSKNDSWSLVNSSVDFGVQGTMFVDSGSRVFYWEHNVGLWRSTNGGTSFTKIFNAPFTGPGIAGCGMFSPQNIDEDSQGNIFFGLYTTDEGKAMRKVWRSTDHGDNWQLVLTGNCSDATNNHLHCLQCDPYHPGYIYVCFGDPTEIYRSTQYGALGTWTLINETYKVTCMFCTPNYRIYGEDYPPVGYNSRILRTSDDEIYIPVWTPSFPYNDQSFYSGSMDSTGRIFICSQLEIYADDDQHPYIVTSGGEPYTVWEIVKDYGAHDPTLGVRSSANHDSMGWGYFRIGDPTIADILGGFVDRHETVEVTDTSVTPDFKELENVGTWGVTIDLVGDMMAYIPPSEDDTYSILRTYTSPSWNEITFSLGNAFSVMPFSLVTHMILSVEEIADEAAFYALDSFILYTLDALLIQQPRKEYNIDALIKALNLVKSYSADVMVEKTLSKVLDVDALIQSLNMDKAFSIDAYLMARIEKSFSADSWLARQAVAKAYIADLILQSLKLPKTYTLDMLLQAIKSQPYTVDLLLKALAVQKTYTTDVLIQKLAQSKGLSADLLIEATESLGFDLDALLQKQFDKTYTADMLLTALGLGKTFDIDTLLQIAQDKTFTVDALLALIAETKTYTVDLLMEKFQIPKTVAVDMLLTAAGLMMKEYTIDLLIQAAKSKGLNVDVLVQAMQSKAIDFDALVKVTELSKSFDIDALLQAVGLPKSYDIDLLLQGMQSKGYPVDALLAMGQITKTYSVDMILQLMGTYKAFQLDVWLAKLGLSKGFSIDAFLAVGLSKTYTTDMLLSATQIVTYDLDTLVKAVAQKGLTADLILIGLVSSPMEKIILNVFPISTVGAKTKPVRTVKTGQKSVRTVGIDGKIIEGG